VGVIDGVEFKDLVTHTDERGFFREVIRSTDPFFKAGFGQLSHSLVHQDVVKAWHGHRWQTQWNYVIAGLLYVALYDSRSESPTFRQTMEFLAGDGQTVRAYMFPPGVLHGYRCLQGPMHITYVTSGVYDIDDEVRLAPDDRSIGIDWSR
jgi:dTDP-4-dehydrorhamnose 3,5-epimerase